MAAPLPDTALSRPPAPVCRLAPLIVALFGAVALGCGGGDYETYATGLNDAFREGTKTGSETSREYRRISRDQRANLSALDPPPPLTDERRRLVVLEWRAQRAWERLTAALEPDPSPLPSALEVVEREAVASTREIIGADRESRRVLAKIDRVARRGSGEERAFARIATRLSNRAHRRRQRLRRRTREQARELVRDLRGLKAPGEKLHVLAARLTSAYRREIDTGSRYNQAVDSLDDRAAVRTARELVRQIFALGEANQRLQDELAIRLGRRRGRR